MAKPKKADKHPVDGAVRQERRLTDRRSTDKEMRRKIAEFQQSLKNEKRAGS